MTTICDCIEGNRRAIVHGLAAAVSAGASAGAVWLVSSAAMPLVGGVIGGLSSLVSMVATRILESQEVIEDEEADYTFLGLEIGTTIVLSLAAAAMGYAISIPLTLFALRHEYYRDVCNVEVFKLKQKGENFMAMVSNCELATAMGLVTAVPAVTATGVTWLVSSATNPLVGGLLGAVSTAVSIAALFVLLRVMGVKKDDVALPILAVELVTPIAFALVATALGYSVSIPLALLLAVTNIASQIAVVSLVS